MITQSKTVEPEVLANSAASWLAAYKANPTPYRRVKYRHPDIKAALVAETSNKCVYCESRIGHNTPGDVEHKIPTSVDVDGLFKWSNLTIACTECNRRKNSYFDAIRPFIDPYDDDVEASILHSGPIAGWEPGNAVAEISVKILELDTGARFQLILEKIEKISELNQLLERLEAHRGETLEVVIRSDIEKMRSRSSKYSAMINALLLSRNYA